MNRERIPNTQATLFDFTPNGQKLLFNGIAPKRGKTPAQQPASLLESISDDLREREVAPMPGQNCLF